MTTIPCDKLHAFLSNRTLDFAVSKTQLDVSEPALTLSALTGNQIVSRHNIQTIQQSEILLNFGAKFRCKSDQLGDKLISSFRKLSL